MWIRLSNLCVTIVYQWYLQQHSLGRKIFIHIVNTGESVFPCRTEGRLLTICPDDFFRYIIIYIVLLTFFINFTFFPFLCLSFFPLFRNTFKKAVLKLCYSFMNKIPSPFYTVPLIFRG